MYKINIYANLSILLTKKKPVNMFCSNIKIRSRLTVFIYLFPKNIYIQKGKKAFFMILLCALPHF